MLGKMWGEMLGRLTGALDIYKQFIAYLAAYLFKEDRFLSYFIHYCTLLPFLHNMYRVGKRKPSQVHMSTARWILRLYYWQIFS